MIFSFVQNPKKQGLVFFILLLSLVFLPPNVQAEEVVKNDLADAIEDGEKDIRFSGKENDDVKIRKGVQVIGESPAKATINGDVTMEDGAILKNVTINANLIGVTVEKGATATLENVTVKGASGAGIFTKEGGGTLTVRNSRITKNGKGFYILSGKNIFITGNQTTDNGEEGLDVRKNVSGIISGNTMTRNAESGAEVVLGDSTVTITKNTFVQNKASGLALQYYSNNKLGKVTVSSNNFTGNSQYGLVCNNPSGGKRPPGFFKNSVELAENSFGVNKKGAMRGCGLVNATLEEQETEEEVAPEIPQVPFEEEPSRIKEVRLEQLTGELLSVEPQVKTPRNYWQSLRHYILKSDRWYFETQRENLRRFQEQLDAARSLPETDALGSINLLFPEKIETLQAKIDELTQVIDRQEQWSPFKQ